MAGYENGWSLREYKVPASVLLPRSKDDKLRAIAKDRKQSISELIEEYIVLGIMADRIKPEGTFE